MAATVTINTAQPRGASDYLDVTATIVPDGGGDPVDVEATGWVSATTNHFPPSAYDALGNRDPAIPPRAMTPAERDAYYLQLVQEDNPQYFVGQMPAFSPLADPASPARASLPKQKDHARP
jgi:hypothetical protein